MSDKFWSKNKCDEECMQFHDDLNQMIREDGCIVREDDNAFDNECADCKRLFCGYHVTSQMVKSYQYDVLGNDKECSSKSFNFSASRCRECWNKDVPTIVDKTDLKSKIEKVIYLVKKKIRVLSCRIKVKLGIIKIYK